MEPNYKSQGDLLEILITDPNFKENDEMIIDECLTFNIAGTLTVAFGTLNTILYLK